MPAKLDMQQDKLIIILSGEIDHHSAKQIREEADFKIIQTRPKEVEFNFKDVTFMDSSGIGLIMGRYRLANDYGGSVSISDMSAYLKRVIRIAGIDSIVTIKNADCSKIEQSTQADKPKED